MCFFLGQAAVDFLLEENLKARVSCWYIKQYIEEQPHQEYKDLLITWWSMDHLLYRLKSCF